MTFMTIFTAPKPFTDPHINIIQRNAIRSWRELGADVDVIVIGDEPGIAEAAKELGARHLPEVACSEDGTPLISSIFGLARENSEADILAYVNADIILLPDFVEMTKRVFEKRKEFLLVGQRWDLDVTEPIKFENGWQEQLIANLGERGEFHKPDGSDYFIFPRDIFVDIPEFRVGRAGWDNWMIYHAVKAPWPAIDATRSIKVVHQKHDYAHLPGGEPHYRHPETFSNIELAGGRSKMCILLDANVELVNGRLRYPRLGISRLLRFIERILYTGEHQGIRWGLVMRLRNLRERFN